MTGVYAIVRWFFAADIVPSLSTIQWDLKKPACESTKGSARPLKKKISRQTQKCNIWKRPSTDFDKNYIFGIGTSSAIEWYLPFLLSISWPSDEPWYISTCCRVERMGVLNEKALSKNDELIFPVSTLRANKMSCWVLRAANEHSLKCLSKSAYDIDVEGLREWAFNHIKNLCWTRSTRSVWTAAAPPQMTLQNSSTYGSYAGEVRCEHGWRVEVSPRCGYLEWSNQTSKCPIGLHNGILDVGAESKFGVQSYA